jgi:arylsulfatase A-like enzyme
LVRSGSSFAIVVALAGCGSKKITQEDSAPPKPVDATVALVDAKPATKSPPERIEHAVFSFVDNRHAAHRYVDGDLVIDAADVGLARYTRFSAPAPHWHLGQTVEGIRAAIVDRLASLEVPLDADMAKKVNRFVVRVYGHDKLSLSLAINGRKGKDTTIALAEGWQTITLPIAPKLLASGENLVVLETTGKSKGDVAIEWMRFAAHDAPTIDDPRKAATFDPKGAITLAKNATLLWYVTVPEGANLVAEVSPVDQSLPCKIEVQARTSDDSFAGGVLGGDSSRVDLTKLAGRVVGLVLTARDCPRAKLAAPAIMLHGPAPAELPKAAPPKFIILWVMDSLRADRIPLFTPGARAQTPNLDELAKTSTVFRQFYVQGNESQASHASFWTGLYPALHDVRVGGAGGSEKLDARFDVLASKLVAAGMYTSGVTGNGYVSAEGGYARGFTEYRNMMRESGIENGVIYGQKILDAALKRLEAHRDRPMFLFLGTIDTHSPWIARHPWIDNYSPASYNGPFKDYGTAKDLGFKPGSMGCGIIPAPDDIERLRAIYDSAISYQDQQLGRLIAQLKTWDIWDQTMLVITADHGEELFEDRRCGHGGSLRDSLLHVPLLVHYPASFPPAFVEEGTEGVDLMPTLLAALKAAPVPAVQGDNIAPLAQGIGRGWARPSYSSMYEYAHAMRIGRWKMRVGKQGTPILGDVVADPNETMDLAASRPVERLMLTDNLGLFLALRKQWKKHDWGVTTNITPGGAAALDRVTTP